MSILIDQSTKLLIQGITGKEGLRSASWINQYQPGSVLAGVTPGKGGQIVEGIPVYNDVQTALAHHPEINASSVYAPPKAVKTAVLDSLKSGLKLIHIIAEEVPLLDSVEILHLAQQHQARIVGPSSIGIISPGKSKIGSIGGGDNFQFKAGSVGVVSKSGGMSSEIALQLTRAGFGQSTVIGIGGNVLIGTTFADLVDDFESDPQTKAVVIVGEIGGAYEEKLAEKLANLPSHKPYVAFLSGRFTSLLPTGMSFGHAGAIVDKNIGTLEGKTKALQRANVSVVNEPSAIIEILNKTIEKDF